MMQATKKPNESISDAQYHKDNRTEDMIKIQSLERPSSYVDGLRGVSSEWSKGQDLSSAICDNVEFLKIFDEKSNKFEVPMVTSSGVFDLDPLCEVIDETLEQVDTASQSEVEAICPLSDDYVKEIMNEDLPQDIKRKKSLSVHKRRQKYKVKADDYLSIADFFGSSTISSSKNHKGNNTQKNFSDPTELDVLLGRGGLANRHPGNKRFRDEARKLNPWYSTSSKTEKYQISEVLVEYIRSHGGRFLEYDRESERWYEVKMARARVKASQALREEKNHKKVRVSQSS